MTGGDGIVYTSWWHQGIDWSGINNNWRPIGGIFPPGAPLAVLSRLTWTLDLFVTGGDGVVYLNRWHEGGDWSGLNGWQPVGGYFPPGAPVAAVSRMVDHIDLFACGNDGVVYQSWWQGDWSGEDNNWLPIGGFFPPGAPVTGVARTTDSIDLLIVGNDAQVYANWWETGYANWVGAANNWPLAPRISTP